jgi:hypothetical protein
MIPVLHLYALWPKNAQCSRQHSRHQKQPAFNR